MYVDVAFTQKTGQNLSTLTYSVPQDTEVEIGQAVKVQIRNKVLIGIIWDIHSKKPDFKTIPIKEIVNQKPFLTKNQIELMKWMEKYYFCSLNKILALFIPKKILSSKPPKEKLQNSEEIYRSRTKKLTTSQDDTIKTITSSSLNKFLIHGITGSGKTEIYTRLAEHYIKNQKQVLILVPEISLTPQIIEYFEKSIGIKAEVIHSKVSEGEKINSWRKVWKNEAKLVIGARKAIFAPFQNLGLIVMDEEHELSYKQDSSPRYNAHQIIEKIQEIDPAVKTVLGSATPSIETSIKLKDHTFTLNKRIGNANLPKIEIVDLREEFKKQNYSIFSETLLKELKKTLAENRQAIIFLNRRGTASSVICRDCGYIEKCPDCEMPMTYHTKTFANSNLICHHCGKIAKTPSECPTCRGINIKFLGIGTQRIEADLTKEFPNARILRADKDTTSTKHGFENIYKKFRNHEADILIGTQMIAKGLHLPKVDLVGVILADIGLNIPDFRTAERNFQLMTQVAGRAGRSDNEGKVIIQTYNPDHITLKCTQEQSYEKFFNYEREQRKILKNPPFSKLTKIIVEDVSATKCKERAEKMEKDLWQILRENVLTEKVEVNFYPAYLSRLRGKYRYIVLIKIKDDDVVPHDILEKLAKEYIMNPTIKIDIDPISIL